jgi:hypothetical protein
MGKKWSPEEAMQDILGRHLDGDLAEACFDSLEGVDHDDLYSIRNRIGERVVDATKLDEIIREYSAWLLNSIST